MTVDCSTPVSELAVAVAVAVAVPRFVPPFDQPSGSEITHEGTQGVKQSTEAKLQHAQTTISLSWHNRSKTAARANNNKPLMALQKQNSSTRKQQ